MKIKSGKRGAQGFSLVEMLVVLVVLVALSGALTYFYLGRGSSKPGDVVHTPLAEANSTVCISNLHQLRQAIDMAKMSDADGKPPASLDSLHLPAEMLACPVGHEPYQYNPSTGKVHCIHPGHENY